MITHCTVFVLTSVFGKTETRVTEILRTCQQILITKSRTTFS